MSNPRLSVPPKSQGKTALMVVLFLVLAGAAGLLTWFLYPSEGSERPPTVRRSIPRPQQKLVEIPVETTPPVEQNEPEADVEPADADEDQAKAKRGKRRRYPQGTMDKRRLSAFIRSKRGLVRQCYERRLKHNNMLQGRLISNIRILPNGKVSNVSISQNTLRDSVVAGCVKRAISRWRFPQPDGGAVSVSVPWSFSPRND